MSISTKRHALALVGLAFALGLVAAGCGSDDLTAPDQNVIEPPGQINIAATPGEINAPWFILRPDEAVVAGEGPALLDEMPAGDYKLMWAPVPGWKSPTPNPQESLLAAGGEISFSATYVEITVATGNIAVDAEPNEIDAPWTLQGPSGFVFEGNGDLVLNEREPGTYTLTFGDVPNYETAGPVQGMLEAGGRLDLGGSYIYQAPPASGTVLIDITPDQINAPWVVTGPGGIRVEGNGDDSILETPVGDYAIQFGGVEGWLFPVPSILHATVTDGGVVDFAGEYTLPDDPNPGDPVIDAIAGQASNGAVLTITGSQFGSHTNDVVSSLGPNGWIESNAPGTRADNLQGAPGWDIGESSGTSPKISNARAYSGNNSCYTYVGPDAEPGASKTWQGALRYGHDTTFEKIYFTYYVYPDLIAGDYDNGPIQWKIWRVNDDGGNGVDDAGEIYQTTQWNASGQPVMYQTTFYGNLGCNDPWSLVYLQMDPEPYYYKSVPSDYRYHDHILDRAASLSETAPSLRTWNRVEVFLEASDNDTYNGRYLLTMNKDGEVRKQLANLSGVLTHQSFKSCLRDNGTQPWQYFTLQSYFDNSFSGSVSERADFFIDDIYLQIGTQARVELGNNPVFDACTRLEVQEVTSWSGTSGEVRIKLNYGGFRSGSQAYLFVVNGDGSVSPGMPITLQ